MSEIEVYYFEDDEFRNPSNLKDVLEGVGEKSDLKTSMRYEIRTFAEEINQGWKESEVLDEESYILDGNRTAEYLETEKGIFVASESNILFEETHSLESRSRKSVVNGE
ncbi:MAG: hypothetical protein ACI8Z7_000406 [Candidatus Nanohaloarchaea archaeon]|jgi:hypothetical protein